MGLVGHLAAEGDREAQGGAGRLAEPGGEQQGGRGAFAEARQGDVGTVRGGHRGGRRSVVRAWLEVVGVVEGVGARVQPVALDEEGTGLDEAERQALGLEPEVARPVPLLLGEGALDDLFQQGQRGAAAEPGEEHLLQVGVDAGGRRVGGGGEEEGALGVAVRSSSRAAPPISRSSTVTTAPIDRTCARSSSRSGRWPGALYTVSKRACSRSVAVRPRPLRRTTPSGARSAQSAATASSRAVRPEPGWPVRRTLRPRASIRTRRSRSSSRSRRGGWGAGGPAGRGVRRRVRGRRARRGCGGRGRRARSPAARPRPRCRPRG